MANVGGDSISYFTIKILFIIAFAQLDPASEAIANQRELIKGVNACEEVAVLGLGVLRVRYTSLTMQRE